jgi:ABC-2 type transport system ATP-binding protein
VPEGAIFGLLGPNGAGKTTLIRIITQIIAPDSGSVYLRDKPLSGDDISRIGYLPEERGLYKKMKVGEQLMYLGQLKGFSRHEVKERLKVWVEKFEIGSWWNKKVEDLSKGMQQKIQFIATVLHRPDLIILDEPFSGFDPINANLIKDEILNLRNSGATIIFSTHRMESVEELCDHIVLINKSKKILEGAKTNIRESFRKHIYQIQHRGPLHGVSDQYTILQSTPLAGGSLQTEVKIPAGSSPNILLRELLAQTEIEAFSEVIPSINEIFIRMVNEEQPVTTE